jgi:histidinol dehydrogenase
MYVPGGKASYPSSVLMNAIPAKVAGVNELVMVVPAPNGALNDLVLAAAELVGVDRVFTIGGAQAIGALVFGTETIPKVDKIVGPGNQYVASAKKQVFGKVGIDMVAGPSEILIYCDGKTDPDWIAMDLFSQAEHDELAQSILIAESDDFFDQVEASIFRLLPDMQRAEIITQSLKNRGAFLKVANEQQAIELINYIAPEHLELSLSDEQALDICEKIHNAGAIFIGRASAEAFGDYCAGSNHVLPTSGSARFSSPLSVYDFVKRSSLIQLNAQNLQPLINSASVIAAAEGLQAHALSAEFRSIKTTKPKSK